MATRPLRPIKVPPAITGDKLVTALRGMGDDFSSDNIRATIQRMVDAGEIAKSDAGHLAILSVYGGDRIEGIGAGQAQLGGVRPVDERYFKGSPAELAAMRRKRSGLLKELTTSVPAEYKPILEAAFRSQEGRKLVANALTKRFKKGKIPTGPRTVERLEEKVRSIGYGTKPGQPTLSLKPADDSKDPALGPAPGREGAKQEARSLTGQAPKMKFREVRTKPEPLGGKRPESRKVGLAREGADKPEPKPKGVEQIQRLANVAKKRKLKSKGARLPEPKKQEPRKGRQLPSSSFGDESIERRALEPKPRRISLESMVRGPEGARYRIAGPRRALRDIAAPRPTARGEPQPSDIPATRRTPRVRTQRGQALEGRKVGKVMKPTLAGVLARIAARSEPPVQDDVRPISWSASRGLGGAHENVPVAPPTRQVAKPKPQYEVEEYYGPAGKTRIATRVGARGPAGRVIKLPMPGSSRMGKARRKMR